MIRLMTDPHTTTFRAALYARVSTEDRQAREDSIAWQRSVAAAVIEGSGGRIVVEYLDVAVSRSLPWSRRPEAARLLSDCSRRDRGFDAVVIGEPQRAFSGAQFALTFPLFVHHGVEIWVPEVGGRVDPDSEAHDLVMSLFGGLSKAERARIQRRVRNAMQTMARAGGRYLGGRPPYGYRLVSMREHPNAEKARLGATLNRLEPDPTTAPNVQRIFRERLAGRSCSAIARMLNESDILSPSAADRARNSHRDPNGWAASAVRAILTNPRYTGHKVAPADGHVRRMRWNPPDTWIWSPEQTHQPLVDRDSWDRVQTTPNREPRAPRRHDTRYLLRGRVHCAVCGRRMTGTNQGNDRRYYRCELRRSRPGARIDHPVDVYVREQPLVEALDDWLNELFAPDRAAETARTIVQSAAHDPARKSRVDQAQHSLADARRKLAQYRAALDGGADPATVTAWITEAAAQERAVLGELEHLAAQAPAPLSVDEAVAVVDWLGGMPGLLQHADQADRAALYAALGVSATYDPRTRSAELAVAIPRSAKNVSEGGLAARSNAASHPRRAARVLMFTVARHVRRDPMTRAQCHREVDSRTG
jgi:DNA invertase Pin-like site-specific DNA recombinase